MPLACQVPLHPQSLDDSVAVKPEHERHKASRSAATSSAVRSGCNSMISEKRPESGQAATSSGSGARRNGEGIRCLDAFE